MPYTGMLFYDFSLHVTELQNIFHLVVRVQDGTDLKIEIHRTLVPFKFAIVFRVYHNQVTGKKPKLMQFGFMIGRQDRLQLALTRGLSPTMTFDDVYLPLPLDDMENEPRPGTIEENWNSIPLLIPQFENGMDHDRVFDGKAKENHPYLSFALEMQLRQNYLQCDVKVGKQHLGSHIKGKMQNRQPLALFWPW